MSDRILESYSEMEKSDWPNETVSLTVEVRELVSTGSLWLGKGQDGLPFVVILTADEAVYQPDQHLKHISMAHGMTCRLLQREIQPSTSRCSIVSCLDPVYIEAFIRFCAMLGKVLTESPSSKMVTRHVLVFADLLAFSQHPSSEVMRGFWSELFIISASRNPDIMLTAWHVGTMDRHDFVFDYERVEVKSCGKRNRKHDFRHDQLVPVNGLAPIIASIQLQSANGPSIENLVHELLDRLDVTRENKSKLLALTMETLGTDWIENATASYDIAIARESLKFFWACDLPQIPEPLPRHVSSLSYSVEIPAELDEADLRQYANIDTLWGVLPFR